MNLNNKLALLFGLLLIICVACSNNINRSENKGDNNNDAGSNIAIITTEEIRLIELEELGSKNTIAISKNEEVESFISSLKISNWQAVTNWELKLFPDYSIIINNNTVIGVMEDKGVAYAKIEHTKQNNEYKYYKIPIDTYDYLIYYYNTHNH